MSSDPFPERIDTVKLFARNGTINAALPLARLPRLIDCLAASAGEVAVQLQFGKDAEGRRLLTGTLDLPVSLTCQRCLGAMPLSLHCELYLLVLDTGEELRELPEDEDAIVAENGELDLPALIEDELLLSLPLVPLHENSDCSAQPNSLREGAGRQGDAQGTLAKPSPFAVLATLKNKQEPDNGSRGQ